ncbi:alpha/beta hydrolase [Saccharopolyspora sp. K220]|uniref:alpha/beta hydrolase n=1 Tax=Saccharopolyspora soli TaxID=2926618 RepID=UPI001F59F18C|nr:alpha/beta hydrolase [Saccharopolyspora soli]MCI2424098.1 alpha/beta hydrolase [Saccharopolyspora soli]
MRHPDAVITITSGDSDLSRTTKSIRGQTMDTYLVAELAAMAGAFPRLDLANLESARESVRQSAARLPVYGASRKLLVHDIAIPGTRGEPDVPCRLYAPADDASEPVAALIYLFGGGYVMGSIEMIDYRARMLVDRASIAVLAVSYRLAPENPYPAALNDAYAALEWVTSSAAVELGVDTSRIGVLGESAGGGLAASLALVARDREGPRLIAQFLDAPTIDDRLQTHSIRTLVDVPVWQPRNSPYSWEYYLRGTAKPGESDVPLYAAPGRATADDAAGLPPAFVTSYQVDPTRDEGLNYALTLIQAGVPTDLHNYAGAFHVAHAVPGTVISARMMDDRVEAVQRLLSDPR